MNSHAIEQNLKRMIDNFHYGLLLIAKKNDISIHDLRLCAYLKIGMNSKEIAEVMNIQPSSAFVSRSRLRKKLNLRVDEDINSFLNAIN
jgi:AraC family chitin signaling transcriptional activator